MATNRKERGLSLVDPLAPARRYVAVTAWGCCVAVFHAGMLPTKAQQNLPSASHAGEILDLWQELQAIDSWECDLFKPKAWDTIAQGLTWALAQKPVGLLSKDNFAILREAPNFKPNYEKYRKAIEAAAEMPGVERVEFELEDMTVEVLWTLQHLGPMLELTLEDRLKADPTWLEQARTEVPLARLLVEEAINRYAANQRRLEKLRLLIGLPIALREALGVDVVHYAAWLEKWEGRDVSQLPDLNIEDVRQTLVNADTLRNIEQAITAELVRIKRHIEPQIAALQLAMEEVQRAARLLYLDCPPGLPDGAPRLRFILKWPENAAAHSYPSAELVLVFPRPAKIPFVVRDADNHPSKEIKAQGEAPADDEYPLGIRIGQVAVQEDGIPRIIAGPINNISLYDADALATSLQRLGLPRELDILSLDIVPNELRHDQIPLIAKLRLPLGESPIEIRIAIEPSKLKIGVEPRQVLRTLAAEQLKQLQDELIRRLQVPAAQLVSAVGALIPTARIELLDGNWIDGKLSARATIKALGVDWVVPLVLENTNDRWRIVPGPVVVPGAIADQLRQNFKKRLQTALSMSADDFDLIQRYVTVENLAYDTRKHQVSGVARFTFDLIKPAIEAPAPFTLGLSDGSINVDFSQLLAVLNDELRKKVLHTARMAILGTVDQALLDKIKSASFDVASLTIRISAAKYEAALKRFTIDAEVLSSGTPLTIANKPIRVRSLYLNSVDFEPNGKLKPPKLDFSDCKIEPGIEHLLGAVAGLKSDWLKISQARNTPTGVSFFAELEIKGLDWPIPLGQLKIGTDGVEWSRDAIVRSITESVTKALADKNLTVGDVGPVKNIKLHELKIADPPTISFAGDIELPAELTLQMLIQVQPTFSIKLLNDPTKVLTAALGKLLPDGAGSGITKFAFLAQKPYGVEFDIKVDAWCFTIEAKNLQIRQNGVHLPGTLRVTIPATIPLAGGLAIVNPGVGLPLGKSNGGGKLEVLGDLTVGGQGIEKILRVASVMSGSLKDLRFDVQGRTILLNFLPVFQVQGLTELGKGRFEVNAQTVGFLDKLFSVRGQQVVDGSKKLVSQDSELAIFGFRIAKVPMKLQVASGGVHLDAATEIKLPIASAHAEFAGTFPKLTDMKATAGVKARVWKFTLGSALVEIQWSRAKLGFEVLSVKLTIITPGPLSLTPSNVLKAILKIFDFNLDLSALLRREITVNLVDETGKKSNNTVGEGEPPPPGAPTEDNTNPGGKPPTSEEKEKRDAVAGPPPAPGAKKHGEQPPNKLPVLVDPGHPQVPSSVYTYRKGSSAMEFESIGSGIFRIIMVSESGHKWQTHWTVTASTKRHLEENMILDEVTLRTVDETGNGRWTCVNNIQHDWTEAFVTLQQSGGDHKVHAVPLRADLPAQELQGEGNPIPEILKNAPGQNFWEWITGQNRPLQPGDIQLIREWARSLLDNRYQGFGRVSQQDVSAWNNDIGVTITGANGYFFLRTDDQKRKSAVFTTRESGLSVEAAEGDLLYYCINSRDDEHLRKLFLLFLECRVIGRGISFVHTAEETPNKPETQLDRVLLHLEATNDSPSELVSVVRGQPGLRRARLHLPGNYGLPSNSNDAILAKLASAFHAIDADEIWVGAVGKERRALLGGKFATDEWWMMTIYFEHRPDGRLEVQPTDLTGAKVAGAVIAERYKRTGIAIGQSPRTLESEVNRRWFAERLFEESPVWAKHLQDNPLPLALPPAK